MDSKDNKTAPPFEPELGEKAIDQLLQQVQFPMTPKQAVKLFGGNMSEYEKVEILE